MKDTWIYVFGPLIKLVWSTRPQEKSHGVVDYLQTTGTCFQNLKLPVVSYKFKQQTTNKKKAEHYKTAEAKS